MERRSESPVIVAIPGAHGPAPVAGSVRGRALRMWWARRPRCGWSGTNPRHRAGAPAQPAMPSVSVALSEDSAVPLTAEVVMANVRVAWAAASDISSIAWWFTLASVSQAWW